MIQAIIKCFERSTVERIEEENSNDVSRCLFIPKVGHGEMRNKKLKIEKKRDYTRMAVLQSLISPWKRKGEKRKKKLLQHGVFVFGHPSKYYPHPTGLNFIERTKHVADLVNTLF